MSSQAQGFASRVLTAFTDAGLYTDQEVIAAGGPSSTKLTQLRRVARGEGEMPEPRGDVHARIDKAAGWKSGSSRKLWHLGAEPILVDPARVLPGHIVEGIMASPILSESQKRELIRQLSEPDPHAPPNPPGQSSQGFPKDPPSQSGHLGRG